MKKKVLKSRFIVLFAIVFIVCFCFSIAMLSFADEKISSGYGFISNNDSGRIIQKKDSVWLTTETATTGNIFDYTYQKALNPNDIDVIYQVVNDTTRGQGSHSRLNFYFIPLENSDISEGVKVQMVQAEFNGDERQFYVDGPTGGAKYAFFGEDFSVNMRLYKESDNWFLNVNGARYQFSGENINKLNSFGKTCYIRTTAHFQENGESSFGMDLAIKSIDKVSFGAISNENSAFASTKLNSTSKSNIKLTENGFELSGKFNSGIGSVAKYALGTNYQTEVGALSSYALTMDISGIDLSVKKYLEISFTNILSNPDRMDAWDSYGDASSQTTIDAITYRIYLTPNSEIAISKYNDGIQGTFNIYDGKTDVNDDPYYEFSSYIPRSDNVLTFQLMKYRTTWKVFVNGACVGFNSANVDLLNSLNSVKTEVSVNLASDDAANYYNSVASAPTDTLIITGINGVVPYNKFVEPEDNDVWTAKNNTSKLTQDVDGIVLSSNETVIGNAFDYIYEKRVIPTEFYISFKVVSDSTRESGAHSRINLYILPSKLSELSEGIRIQLINAKPDNNSYAALVPDMDGGMQTVYYSEDYLMNVRVFKEGNNWFANFNGSRLQFTNDNAEKLNSMNYAFIRTTAHYQENGEQALNIELKIYSIDGKVFGKEKELSTLFSSQKNNTLSETKTEIDNGQLYVTGKYNLGVINTGKYGFGNDFCLSAGELVNYTIILDTSKVDKVVKKNVEISFTNILNNNDRMDAWDSYSDANSQPTILAATYRLALSTEKTLCIVKTADGFSVIDGENHLENAPHYEFDSFIPRADGLLIFQILKTNGEWKILINGAAIGFNSVHNELLNALNATETDVCFSLCSDNASAYYNGENVPTDTLTIKGINGNQIGKEIDTRIGDYADDINGELEFVRTDYVNIAPETATYDYSVTNDGLKMYGINEQLGFAAGLNYINDLNIDHDNELTFTIKMPEQVYASNSKVFAGYCFFIGDSTHKNFSEQISIYLRLTYQAEDIMVPSATTSPKLEVIMWDNTTEQKVMTSCSSTINPKTTEGRETEMTFRFVFDEKDNFYRIYVNGQRATNTSVEKILTDYIDNIMLKHYFSCTFDYSKSGVAEGAWENDNKTYIGSTLIEINGKKIVNKVPDMFAGITLSDATEITQTSAKISWTKGEYVLGDFDSFNFTPTGYKIIRSVATIGESGVPEVTIEKTIYIDNIETLFYIDNELKENSIYYYTVYVVEKSEEENYIDLFRSNLNKRVATLSSEVNEPNDNKDEEKTNSGCKSNMYFSSIILFTIISLASVFTLFIYKRKD